MGSVMRWVRPEEILGVIDGEPRVWPDAKGLHDACDERDGKRRGNEAPVFWTVGVDQNPEIEV